MPHYDYICKDTNCENKGKVIEIYRKMSDNTTMTCEKCNSALTQIVTTCAFQFKGGAPTKRRGH